MGRYNRRAMSTQATYDDANLVLRLYELRREEKMRAARDWFMREFKAKTVEEYEKLCPMGSQESAYARMVVSYWEMTCGFVTNGVLNGELFLQSGLEFAVVFERIRQVLPGMRKSYQNPGYLKNLEAVGAMAAEYLERQGPGTYAAFAARWRG